MVIGTMARAKTKGTSKTRIRPGRWLIRFIGRWLRRIALTLVALICLGVSLYTFVNPPTTFYQMSESIRLGGIDRDWVPIEDMAPVMARSVVAAEDANFCLHWGFDMAAIRQVIEAGENRGASTLSQQVVKNVFLWHGRTYTRKALEGLITPAMELVWSKRRIVEVYLNVVEFDEGVFGAEAAAQHYFGVSSRDLTATQAALLAAVLPDPKGRDASRPSSFMQRRSASIRDGAETIRVDGRSDCFED
ncbi:monofunctional biosynthetic peptidoglycan transglycosylase [uncultured Maritimibacter sp.]|jgi:monofunctional biosynthetic peptidoglycan transglycosylase|uniref:monofunctional biosynthetic peptidoglycan transglycosylase n=1 Tax=uncultured Maritimibacter sp. TaxID=991866 RepID=UPI000AB86DB0|nr:monofunctional biosynthetic peptidoglycan transglycosylase [uncultured Maritimibacter sp.]